MRIENGESEGVPCELLSAVFINAIKQQQRQIEHQRKLIEELQATASQLVQANRQTTAR